MIFNYELVITNLFRFIYTKRETDEGLGAVFNNNNDGLKASFYFLSLSLCNHFVRRLTPKMIVVFAGMNISKDNKLNDRRKCDINSNKNIPMMFLFCRFNASRTRKGKKKYSVEWKIWFITLSKIRIFAIYETKKE